MTYYVLLFKSTPIGKPLFWSHSNPIELASYGNAVLARAAKQGIDLPRLGSARVLDQGSRGVQPR